MNLFPNEQGRQISWRQLRSARFCVRERRRQRTQALPDPGALRGWHVFNSTRTASCWVGLDTLRVTIGLTRWWMSAAGSPTAGVLEVGPFAQQELVGGAMSFLPPRRCDVGGMGAALNEGAAPACRARRCRATSSPPPAARPPAAWTAPQPFGVGHLDGRPHDAVHVEVGLALAAGALAGPPEQRETARRITLAAVLNSHSSNGTPYGRCSVGSFVAQILYGWIVSFSYA